MEQKPSEMFDWNIDAWVSCYNDTSIFPKPMNTTVESGKGRDQNVPRRSNAPKYIF